MNRQHLLDNPQEARQIYEKLLDQLLQLELQGLDQTDEADTIREQMDGYWYAMDDDDRKEMDNKVIAFRQMHNL